MSKKLQYLIIHGTATSPNQPVTAEDIRRWHTTPIAQGGRGWRQVGYSDLITLSGDLVNLVPYDDNDIVEPWEITNGARGFNAIARHVVMAGGLHPTRKTPFFSYNPAQMKTLKEYVEDKIAKHSHILVGPHYAFANTACPCFNVPAWLKANGIPEKNIFTRDPFGYNKIYKLHG